MSNKVKTDNFLKAIKKHSEAQKAALHNQVEQLKTEKLAETEKKAQHDSEKLIKDKLEEKRNQQTRLLAKKTQDGQKKLFLERAAMTEKIFKKAQEKLIEYTKTNEYLEMLRKSASEIAELFGNNGCVLYVNEHDLNSADSIKAVFGGSAEVIADKSIKIGGIRGYCESMSIVADETLDSKLAMQKDWFIENSTLSVL